MGKEKSLQFVGIDAERDGKDPSLIQHYSDRMPLKRLASGRSSIPDPKRKKISLVGGSGKRSSLNRLSRGGFSIYFRR